MNTTGCTDNNLGTFLEGLHILTNTRSTNASMALNAHEITDGDNNLLNLLSQLTGRGKDQCLALLDGRVNLLEDGNGEGGSLASSGLGLRDYVVTYSSVSIWRI